MGEASPVVHQKENGSVLLLFCFVLPHSLEMPAGRQKRKAGPEASGGSPGGRGAASGACAETTNFHVICAGGEPSIVQHLTSFWEGRSDSSRVAKNCDCRPHVQEAGRDGRSPVNVPVVRQAVHAGPQRCKRRSEGARGAIHLPRTRPNMSLQLLISVRAPLFHNGPALLPYWWQHVTWRFIVCIGRCNCMRV
jgi:hypothetical protein